MMNKIKERVKKEQFDPSFFGLFINPFYIARKGLAKEIRLLANFAKGRMLDVGCGQCPYIHFFHYDEYVGLEIDTPENRTRKKAALFYDGKHIPAENNSFDFITCNQVFEHVFNPDEFLDEIYRVLKPEGGFLITVPFIWDEHEQPIDYARYSSFGLKYILTKHGFQVIDQKKTVNDTRIIFQLIIVYIYKKIITSNSYINLLLFIFCMSPFNILGELLYRILPKNNDLYLDNIILARKQNR